MIRQHEGGQTRRSRSNEKQWVDRNVGMFASLVSEGGQGFGVGSNPPGAQVPFGAFRLSPDTALDTVALEWEHFGGYYHGERLFILVKDY